MNLSHKLSVFILFPFLLLSCSESLDENQQSSLYSDQLTENSGEEDPLYRNVKLDIQSTTTISSKVFQKGTVPKSYWYAFKNEGKTSWIKGVWQPGEPRLVYMQVGNGKNGISRSEYSATEIKKNCIVESQNLDYLETQKLLEKGQGDILAFNMGDAEKFEIKIRCQGELQDQTKTFKTLVQACICARKDLGTSTLEMSQLNEIPLKGTSKNCELDGKKGDTPTIGDVIKIAKVLKQFEDKKFDCNSLERDMCRVSTVSYGSSGQSGNVYFQRFTPKARNIYSPVLKDIPTMASNVEIISERSTVVKYGKYIGQEKGASQQFADLLFGVETSLRNYDLSKFEVPLQISEQFEEDTFETESTPWKLDMISRLPDTINGTKVDATGRNLIVRLGHDAVPPSATKYESICAVMHFTRITPICTVDFPKGPKLKVIGESTLDITTAPNDQYCIEM